MKNLELFFPVAVMALFAALRHWVLPHVNLDPVQQLFGPLEIATYAVSVYIYARNPSWLMWLYAILPAAAILWKDIFNYVTLAASLIK
ncbi:MAG: hypothetical protein EON60_10755 [Alphaproteobacteria bacterium]|nr:MAG: hypothetical protein EON60_10755 [Alphaproteobacteria bacterium]